MTDLQRRSTGIALLLTVGLAITPAEAEISGPPTIIDGDSLEVGGHRLDLHGIDAPELGLICRKKNGKSFDCGNVARTALLDLTAGLDVVCVPIGEAGATPASPLPASCSAGGFSLNRNMIHTGWAVADRSVSSAYIATELDAKQAERGLWRWNVPPPPWPAQAD